MELCVCCISAPTTDSLLSTLESSVQHIVREDERKAWRYTADLAKLRARPVRFGGGDYASDDDGNDDGNVDAGDVSDDDADGQYDFDDVGAVGVAAVARRWPRGGPAMLAVLVMMTLVAAAVLILLVVRAVAMIAATAAMTRAVVAVSMTVRR